MDTKRWIIVVVLAALLGLFIVNDFVLDEPIWVNQHTEQDTTQKGN